MYGESPPTPESQLTSQISKTILTNMTTGEFWNKITVLANVFDGRVTCGPMSINWMKRELRKQQPPFPLGQVAEMQMHNAHDLSDLKTHAHRLGLYAQELIGVDRMVIIEPTE